MNDCTYAWRCSVIDTGTKTNKNGRSFPGILLYGFLSWTALSKAILVCTMIKSLNIIRAKTPYTITVVEAARFERTPARTAGCKCRIFHRASRCPLLGVNHARRITRYRIYALLGVGFVVPSHLTLLFFSLKVNKYVLVLRVSLCSCSRMRLYRFR